jgi:hypothetical protein
MKRALMFLPMSIVCGQALAEAPERAMSLDAVKIETIRIDGQVRTWVIDKICIDGQAYLTVLGSGSPSTITAAFKDGKPERCQAKPGK